GVEKVEGGEDGKSSCDCADVEDTNLVSQTTTNEIRRTSPFETVKNTSSSTIRQKSCTPSLSKAKLDGLHLIRQKMKKLGNVLHVFIYHNK
ncbi:hypothetical protein ElyMa_003995300, partial [Elysia marginata]